MLGEIILGIIGILIFFGTPIALSIFLYKLAKKTAHLRAKETEEQLLVRVLIGVSVYLMVIAIIPKY